MHIVLSIKNLYLYILYGLRIWEEFDNKLNLRGLRNTLILQANKFEF